MNQSYVILTESSSDLTPELAAQAGAEVLPLNFTMEGKNYPHYPDERAMSIPEFYVPIMINAVQVFTDDVTSLCHVTSSISRIEQCRIMVMVQLAP